MEKGECLERENLIQRRKDVIKLCDWGFVCAAFKDDPILNMVPKLGSPNSRFAGTKGMDNIGTPRRKCKDISAAEY